MLKIYHRTNELVEASYMIDVCLTREKGDLSHLDFFKKKLKLNEEELKEKYHDIYDFYLNIYDDGVDLLKDYQSLVPYLKLPFEEVDGSYMTQVLSYLHIVSPTLLTLDDFIYSCKFALYSMDGTLEKYEHITEKDRLELIAELEMPGIDFSDIFSRVNRTTYTDNDKIILLSLFQNINNLYPMFLELYTKGIEIYRRYLHRLERYIQMTEKHIQKEDGTLVDVHELEIAKYVDFNNEQLSSADYSISISVMRPRAMSMIFSINDRIMPQIICGIFVYGIEDDYAEEQFSEHSILEQMKALGDSTRLKIIRLLATRPYYTKEIAEIIGITPATVSHHMNILLNAKFVIFIGDGRKSTYKINHKEMDNLSRYFKQLGGE